MQALIMFFSKMFVNYNSLIGKIKNKKILKYACKLKINVLRY